MLALFNVLLILSEVPWAYGIEAKLVALGAGVSSDSAIWVDDFRQLLTNWGGGGVPIHSQIERDPLLILLL